MKSCDHDMCHMTHLIFFKYFIRNVSICTFQLLLCCSFLGNEEKYKEIFEIIDRRWEIQLHQPLHAAGYFLNP